MTVQVNDKFIENRKVHPVLTSALDVLLDKHSVDATEFADALFNSCYRGYRASWKVMDGELLLWDLKVPSLQWYWVAAPKEFKNEILALSGSSRFPVLANWFTGDFIVGFGERYSSMHAFGIYEIERIFTIRNGLVHKDRRRRRIAPAWVEILRE